MWFLLLGKVLGNMGCKAFLVLVGQHPKPEVFASGFFIF